MTFNPYQTLDVPRNADPATIKRAYRRKAKRLHPDTGGNARDFHEASRAVQVLLDPQRRKHYDETGEIDESSVHNDPLGEAKTLVLHFFLAAVASPNDLFKVDLIDKARENFRQHIQHITGQIKIEQTKIKKFEKLEQRLRHKDNNDFVRLACRSQVRELTEAIRKHDAQIKIREQSIELLKEYSFEQDPSASTIGGWTVMNTPSATGGFFR